MTSSVYKNAPVESNQAEIANGGFYLRGRLVTLLRRVSHLQRCTWAWVAVLFLLSTCSQPYAGLIHDAKLYSFQVANRTAGGHYDQDLFLAFGSQDQYSLFSFLVAPLAALVGVESSFFIAWIATTVALLFGEVMLVERCVRSPTVRAAILVFLAVADLPYGGRLIFHVHEPFFSARQPAAAFVILGLALWMRGHVRAAWGLHFVAMTVHPLMSMPGVALLVAGIFERRVMWKRWSIYSFAATLAVPIAFAFTPLSSWPRGVMSQEWLEAARIVSHHCFPSLWECSDWIRIAVSLVVLGGVYLYHGARAPQQVSHTLVSTVRSLSWSAILLAIGSVGLTIVAEWTANVLLLQAQPYRGLWVVQVVASIVGIGWLVDVWRKHKSDPTIPAQAIDLRWLVTLLVVYMIDQTSFNVVPSEVVAFIVEFFVPLYIVRTTLKADIFQRLPNFRVWASVIPWLAALLVYSAIEWFNTVGGVVSCLSLGEYERDWSLLPFTVPRVLGNTAAWFLAGGLLCWGVSRIRAVARMGIVAAISAVTALLAIWSWNTSPTWQHRTKLQYRNRDFVVGFLRERQTENRTPQVYWPSEPDVIWFDARANSYYSWTQMQGAIFSQPMAFEGRRRACLAVDFETAEQHRIHPVVKLTDQKREFMKMASTETGCPTSALLRLAADPILDWIVLYQDIDNLAATSNGSAYIYDCAALRKSMREGTYILTSE